MTLQIDDIREGQWIAITSFRHEKSADDCYGFWSPQPKYPPMAGAPMRVIAKCLPFLVVELGGQRGTLDTREFAFARLTPRYVEALTAKQPQVTQDRVNANGCPKCGGRLIQRHNGPGSWGRYCRECEEFVGVQP